MAHYLPHVSLALLIVLPCLAAAESPVASEASTAATRW